MRIKTGLRIGILVHHVGEAPTKNVAYQNKGLSLKPDNTGIFPSASLEDWYQGSRVWAMSPTSASARR
jgi:hypothetical protein